MNETLKRCEEILKTNFSGDTQLQYCELVADYSSYWIIRCNVLKTTENRLPNSVIIKQSKSPNTILWNEIVSLNFLNSFSALQGIPPKLYGFDPKKEIILMEDLDKGCKENEYSDNLLGKILLKENNYTTAINALTEFQKTIAQIQALTVSEHQGFLNAKVGFEGAEESRHAVHKIEEALLGVPKVLKNLDLRRYLFKSS